MDSDASGFVLDPASFGLVYCQDRKNDGIIDLGLSLKTLHPETYQQSGHSVTRLEEYSNTTDWPRLDSKHLNAPYTKATESQNFYAETEAVQSQERWAYVKVNMDGVVVGRKVCILDHPGYSSLALQLEDMFGQLSLSGLRLFQAESEYLLLYKDTKENWRAAGDAPWKEFAKCVKRLRIARK